MKKIWNLLKMHLVIDFNPGHYATVIVFLVAALSLNYAFDFEDNQLETMAGYRKFFAYLIFYGIPYTIVNFSYCFFNRRRDILQSRQFWLRAAFGVLILSLDASMPFLSGMLGYFFVPEVYYWMYKVSVNAISFITVFIPILIFYQLADRNKGHRYGLTPQRFDVRPYFLMLLIMLPFLVGASFTESFLRQYPMYKTSEAHLYLGVPEWVTVAAYELAYGFDFVTVEYLFRGFFVIGMMSVLGRGSVLSMAVLYCFLHFGKPAGEAISSVAGGYILGVIAYETRGVWGGVIVHMGIAWMMELIAFIQKSL